MKENKIFRGNYPYNIEAPQRLYIVYSQDIDFDYSKGNTPLGEEYEGFVWENTYIPIEHTDSLGNILGPHMWMRIRVGEREEWTQPMKFKEPYSNITTTTPEVNSTTGEVKFRLVYYLDDGTIIYSDYITLTNGANGRGISSSMISGNNLVLNYTDNTSENVGRVVGYNGYGFPSAGSDIENNIAIVDSSNNVIWQQFIDTLNDHVSTTLPIEYLNGTFSHSNIDGYRHIPIGGNNGNVLTTDGSGNYTWFELGNVTNGYIPWSAIDDNADIGATSNLWSASKIATMFAGLSTFGIKYAVDFISELSGIVGMDADDLCVVDEDRYVYKYDGFSWNQFFRLDADHNHDDRYYTKSELNTAGAGGQVAWANIPDRPTNLFQNFTIAGTTGSVVVNTGDTINFLGNNGLSTTVTGLNVYINGYIPGSGIDITGLTISHSDTSTAATTNNTGGSVLQNLTFDTYGHVTARSSLNLDGRYSLLNHTHATLARGIGLTGVSYNGSTGTTWSIDFGLGSSQVARGSHTHTGLASITSQTFALSALAGTANKVTRYDFDGNIFVTVRLRSISPSFSFGYNTLIGYIPNGYRPTSSIHAQPFHYHGTNGDEYSGQLYIHSNGEIRIARNTTYGALTSLNAEFSYTV